MVWGTKGTSAPLTLGAGYSIIQESAADLEISLNPGESCQLIFDVDFQASPTEDADIVINKSVDGTEFESDGESDRYIMQAANRETDDPAELSVTITGCHTFRIKGRVRDTDDTAGGDDTGSTLTVHYRKDGISI